MAETIKACRICGSVDLPTVLDLGEQQMTGIFPKTRGEDVGGGPLELVRCGGDCNLVQLRHIYDPALLYGGDYGYRSGLNRSMIEHLREKAAMFHDFGPDDIVLDIGANDGTLLSMFPSRLYRIGMDPTIAKFGHHYPPGITAIADFFSPQLFFQASGGKRAKLVTSIACFYDLQSPMQFVRDVHSVLHDGGLWHFEQSYLPRMMSQRAYDTVCHEHVEYYSLKPIFWMLARAGFQVVSMSENAVNGGSIAITVKKGSQATEAGGAGAAPSLEEWRQFASSVRRHRTGLLATLESLKLEGKTIIGLGASTKGNVLLQYCGIGQDTLDCIGEVNPAKFGCYTPGTGIPIVSEEEAFALKPDVALVLPWHFEKTMTERYRDRGCELLYPLPTIHNGCRRLV